MLVNTDKSGEIFLIWVEENILPKLRELSLPSNMEFLRNIIVNGAPIYLGYNALKINNIINSYASVFTLNEPTIDLNKFKKVISDTLDRNNGKISFSSLVPLDQLFPFLVKLGVQPSQYFDYNFDKEDLDQLIKIAERFVINEPRREEETH